MRRVVSLILAGGFLFSLYATDARISAMGRTDRFIRDDGTIFWNPSTVNFYPNMLIGSLGYYSKDPFLDDTSQLATLKPANRDPQRPYFGGILSYSLGDTTERLAPYPMVSIGIALNRYDYFLEYITPGSKKFLGSQSTNVSAITYADPVGKADLILGYTMPSGVMVGAGLYVAYQKIEEHGLEMQQTKMIKASIGAALPIAREVNFEVSLNSALMSKIGTIGKQKALPVADDDLAFRGDARIFAPLPHSINGSIVPHIGAEYIRFHNDRHGYTEVEGGIGANIILERGFFWSGVELLYEENEARYYPPEKITDTARFVMSDLYAMRVSFGIERNFFWEWLNWRIGGTKMVGFLKEGGPSGDAKWIENAEADASDEDHIAFGWTVNIDNRFRIDAIMAEDIFYTFTNLLSGNNHHHLFTRFTATYNF